MKRLVPFLLLALSLSACTIRVDIGVAVDEAESGTFALFMGFDEEFREFAEQSGEGFDLTQDLGDVPADWSVDEVTEDGFEGVRISADFDSLDDLKSRLAELNESGTDDAGTDVFTDFSLVRSGDEFRFTADLSQVSEELAGSVGEGGSDDLFSGVDPATFFSNLFEIRLRLTLPGEIGPNNADVVDGNTLTWNVAFDDQGTYTAESTLGGGSSPILLVLIVLAILVAVGVALVMVRRRKEELVATPLGDPTSTPEGLLPADPFGG